MRLLSGIPNSSPTISVITSKVLPKTCLPLSRIGAAVSTFRVCSRRLLYNWRLLALTESRNIGFCQTYAQLRSRQTNSDQSYLGHRLRLLVDLEAAPLGERGGPVQFDHISTGETACYLKWMETEPWTASNFFGLQTRRNRSLDFSRRRNASCEFSSCCSLGERSFSQATALISFGTVTSKRSRSVTTTSRWPCFRIAFPAKSQCCLLVPCPLSLVPCLLTKFSSDVLRRDTRSAEQSRLCRQDPSKNRGPVLAASGRHRRRAFGFADRNWGKWRGDRDSNPGDALTPNGFQDRRIRPLCHLPGAVWFMRSTSFRQDQFRSGAESDCENLPISIRRTFHDPSLRLCCRPRCAHLSRKTGQPATMWL